MGDQGFFERLAESFGKGLAKGQSQRRKEYDADGNKVRDTKTQSGESGRKSAAVTVSGSGIGNANPDESEGGEDDGRPYAPTAYYRNIYGQPRDINIHDIRRYEKSTWVQMALNGISRRVAGTPRELVVDEDMDTDLDAQNAKAEVEGFLDEVNPNGVDFRHLEMGVVNELGVVDSGVVIKVFTKDSYDQNGTIEFIDGRGDVIEEINAPVLKPFGERELKELWLVDGATVQKQLDIKGLIHSYYQYNFRQPTGTPIRFQPDEVCYNELNPAGNRVYGFSPVQSCQQVVDLLIRSTQANKDLLEHGLIPDGMINIPGADKQTIEAVKREWEQRTEDQHHPLVVHGGEDMSFEQIRTNPKDMDWLDGQKWFYHLVFGVFGISPQTAGFTEDSNYATEEGQAQKTEDFGVDAYRQTLENMLNRDIIPELFQRPRDEIPVEFEYQPENTEKEQVKFDRRMREVENGLLTPNEYRAMQGREPLEGGDTPQQPRVSLADQLGEHGKSVDEAGLSKGITHRPSWDEASKESWESPDIEDFDTRSDYFDAHLYWYDEEPQGVDDVALPVTRPNDDGDIEVVLEALRSAHQLASRVEGLNDEQVREVRGLAESIREEAFPDAEPLADKAVKQSEYEYSVGDYVQWAFGEGSAEGEVISRENEPGEGFTVQGNTREATEDEPVYLIQEFDDEQGEFTNNVVKSESEIKTVERPEEAPDTAPRNKDAGNPFQINKVTEDERRPNQGMIDAAQQALDYAERHDWDKDSDDTPGRDVGWNRAEQIVEGDPISEEDWLDMAAWWARHEDHALSVDEDKEPHEDHGYVAGLLWGGKPGRDKSMRMRERIEDEESKSLAGITPKGIDPATADLSKGEIEELVKASDSYTGFVRNVFASWRDKTIAAFRRLNLEKTGVVKDTFGEFMSDLTNAVNTEAFQQGLEEQISQSVDKGRELANQELEVDVEFGPSHDQAVGQLAEQQLDGYQIGGERWHGIRGVSNEVQTEILRTVEEGVQEKQSRDSIVENIRDTFDTVTDSQARRIARTETTRFVNEGKLTTWKDAGVEDIGGGKVWDAVIDGDTSDVCRRLNDRYGDDPIPLGEEFIDPRTNEAYPYPPAHPNCRSRTELRLLDE